jgi:23S rRNA pseudouridine2605 synthase
MSEEQRERLAKRIAGAGLCSRRTAEEWIVDGRVKVNGKCIITPAFTVTADDLVQVDGQPLNDKPTPRLWLYHKPKGLVTTHRDPQGRPTVFGQLPKEWGHVLSVGRLDVQSEGLLLLTNSGTIARHLELPSTGWMRRYRVRLFQKPTADTLHKLEKGVTVEGIRYGSILAEVTHGTGSNSWLEVSLSEGKNREG